MKTQKKSSTQKVLKQGFRQVDDDEGFDEISIKVAPHMKTSGLSGDGWRVSAVLKLLRKGKVIVERSYGSLKDAEIALPWFVRTCLEQDPREPREGEFTEHGIERVEEGLGGLLPNECAQPGCSNDPVSVYRLKKDFSQCCQEELHHDWHGTQFRAFCADHLDRGDCHLSDSNQNYVLVSGSGAEGVDKS